MEMAYEYINKGLRISKVAEILNIPRSRFYRSKIADKNNNKPIKPGRKNSAFTLRKDGNNTIILDNNAVVNDIKKLLSGEFVCYGYKKTAKYLNRHGYVINRKKVRRLMSENNLLNYTYNNRKPATRVINTVVKVNNTNQVWEFDIKYIYIHGESRNTYLLAMIDCYTREVVGYYLGYQCTGNDVKNTMMEAFEQRGLNNISGIRMRSDNGTQFICNTVEYFLSMMNIHHEGHVPINY